MELPLLESREEMLQNCQQISLKGICRRCSVRQWRLPYRCQAAANFWPLLLNEVTNSRGDGAVMICFVPEQRRLDARLCLGLLGNPDVAPVNTEPDSERPGSIAKASW